MEDIHTTNIKYLIELAGAIFELATMEKDLQKLEVLKKIALEVTHLLDAEEVLHPELGFNLIEFTMFQIDIAKDSSVDYSKEQSKIYGADIKNMLKAASDSLSSRTG